MQLRLFPDERTQTLADIDARLRRHFGALSVCLELDPVSQLVLAFIGGRTRGAVSKDAFERLIRRFGCWERVRDAPVADIRRCIRTVTYAEAKAARLKKALKQISDEEHALSLKRLNAMTVADALKRLERLPGVGRKVSAATLNFSTLRKRALVIDTHHMRVLKRLNLISQSADFRRAYDEIAPALPLRWSAKDVDEHHQYIKALGQTCCKHGLHDCLACPLHTLCPTGVVQTAL
jgi:endonuclease-3